MNSSPQFKNTLGIFFTLKHTESQGILKHFLIMPNGVKLGIPLAHSKEALVIGTIQEISDTIKYQLKGGLTLVVKKEVQTWIQQLYEPKLNKTHWIWSKKKE